MGISTKQITICIAITIAALVAKIVVASGEKPWGTWKFWGGMTELNSTGKEEPWWSGVPTKLIKKTTLVQASPDRLPVHTLTFAVPRDATFTGRAMPHADVRIDIGDVVKMVIPDYKPKSYSISALRQDEFDVTFKVYPNGRASGFLDRLKVGEEMNTFGMSTKRIRNAGDYVGIIAYGVGITEALPVATAELEKGDAKRVVVLWASRTKEDTFWKDEVEELMRQYPTKFELLHILSRQHVEGCLHGRVNADVMNMVFKPEQREGARFLSVGTKEMMAMTDNILASMGYPMPKHSLLYN